MIRKKALSVLLTVTVLLTVLFSATAMSMTRRDSTALGSHANSVLAEEIPTPTATPGGAGTDSNPSGGGNGGG